MGKEMKETEAFVDAAVDVGMSTLIKLIEAGSGKSLMIEINGEVWEITATKKEE